jgi:carbonic anhydrase
VRRRPAIHSSSFPFFQEKKYGIDVVESSSSSLQVMLITCIDSRCNPTMLLGLEAGEAFVVRNVANFVHPYDEAGQVRCSTYLYHQH